MTVHILTPLRNSNGLKNATQWIQADGDESACPVPSGGSRPHLSVLLTDTHPGKLTARAPCQQGRLPSQTHLSRPAPRPNASLLWPAASWVSPRDVRPGHHKPNVSKGAASRCPVSPSRRGRLSVAQGTTRGSLYSPLCPTPQSIQMILPSDCTRPPLTTHHHGTSIHISLVEQPRPQTGPLSGSLPPTCSLPLREIRWECRLCLCPWAQNLLALAREGGHVSVGLAAPCLWSSMSHMDVLDPSAGSAAMGNRHVPAHVPKGSVCTTEQNRPPEGLSGDEDLLQK